MHAQFDWSEPAALLERLPPDKDGSPQYRELITGDVRRCVDHAATLTAEARSITHIELVRGGRIALDELDAFADDRADGSPAAGDGPAPGTSDAMSNVKLT